MPLCYLFCTPYPKGLFFMQLSDGMQIIVSLSARRVRILVNKMESRKESILVVLSYGRI